MKLRDNGTSFVVWVSAQETRHWARWWPCSGLSGRRVMAAFDTNGLYDLAVDGKDWDGDANELSALVADFAGRRIKEGHPCYFVAVGQFKARA